MYAITLWTIAYFPNDLYKHIDFFFLLQPTHNAEKGAIFLIDDSCNQPAADTSNAFGENTLARIRRPPEKPPGPRDKLRLPFRQSAGACAGQARHSAAVGPPTVDRC
jgi:hypothetical protein